MSEPILSAQELDAIRQTIGEGQRAQRNALPIIDASPIALIADDRAAERARPDGLKMAQRWAPTVVRRLQRLCGAKVVAETVEAQITDGVTAKLSLVDAWTRSVVVAGKAGLGILAITGPMIEGLAARLLGSSNDEPPIATTDRPPSQTALRVFSPIGEALAVTLCDAWRTEQAREVVLGARGLEDEWLRELGDNDLVVKLCVTLTGTNGGRLQILARPETMALPAPPVRVVLAADGAITQVLGHVPVDLRVELGRATLTMSELAMLQPGTVIAVHQARDGLLPVRIGGLQKAVGRALIVRGALAVEIVDPQSVEEPGQDPEAFRVETQLRKDA